MKKIITAIALTLTFALGMSACSSTREEVTNTTITTSVVPETTTEPTEPEESETTTSESEATTPSSRKWEWEDHLQGVLVSPSGSWFSLGNPYCRILSSDENRCLIWSDFDHSSIWLADATDGSLNCLSGDQLVVDFQVAYDTIYWLNTNREVWSSDWQSDDYTSKLFVEDAIGVSHHTDECEGAIVDPERANWKGYGGLPYYSPYGIQ